jgi:hypothetical protein
MTVGNLTGDGSTKLAITDGQGVYVYDLERNGIKLLWSAAGVPTDNILSLDAGDINGNGVDEIFVTNYSRGSARSYVLEYQKGTFQRISEDIPLHFRTMDGPAGALQLYGQAAGINRPFDGPVRRYAWQGGRYQPVEPVILPKQFNVLYGFAFADLEADAAPKVAVLDHNDYLRLYDRGGTEIYRSGERFGGTERFIEYDPMRAGEHNRAGIQPERLLLQPRMLSRDVLGDGKKQLIVPRNTPSTGYMFQTRLYDRGKIFGLGWDGLGMQELWETRELPGYVADFALVQGEEGQRRLVVLVVQTNLLGMTTSKSSVVLLDLKPPA